jgi:hypothetical protein
MVGRYEIGATTSQRVRAVAGRTAPALLFLVIAGGGVLVADSIDPFGRALAFTGIVAMSVVAVVLFALATRVPPDLVVEAAGIRFGPAAVPWASIRHVVIAAAGPDGHIEIGLRLKPDAPLPEGVSSAVFDPRRPQALHVRGLFRPGRIDRHRFVATARALAPPDVAVLTEPADPAPAPSRQRAAAAAGTGHAPAVVTAVRLRPSGRVFLRTPSWRGMAHRHRFAPHPVVSFSLPDGRRVVSETSAPGTGSPGQRVSVTFAAADPTDVCVDGAAPPVRWIRSG